MFLKLDTMLNNVQVEFPKLEFVCLSNHACTFPSFCLFSNTWQNFRIETVTEFSEFFWTEVWLIVLIGFWSIWEGRCCPHFSHMSTLA